jgi:Domain of unknown function (DUF5666)
MKTISFRYVSRLILFAALAGCNGGGSVAGGGIGGTGVTVSAVSVGTVTQFGSVFVNDVEFNTTDAEVIAGGEVRGRGDAAVTSVLSRGMVVRVEGRLDGALSGTAVRVVFDPNVEGPVEAIASLDESVTELVVMGQTVRADDRTVFVGTTLNSIAVGNVLEVSGLIDQTGTIFASYINKKADALAQGSPVEARGVVQDLNSTLHRFTINSLTIDYSAATVTGFTGAGPAPGELVSVKGRLADPSTLVATNVEFKNELGRDDVETADIEGFVTQFTSTSQFALGSIAIVTDDATVFKEAAAGDLSVGIRLKVRGSATSGTVLADEVAVADHIKMESDVESLDLAQGTLTLSGLSPIVIATDSSTKFTGAPDLSQVNTGDHVKIFARLSASGTVIATKLLIKPGSGTVGLKGPVATSNQPSLEVVGVTIDTSNNIPPGSFVAADGRSLSANEFFSALQIGDTVNAEGTLAGQQVIWNRIESE